jgi:hypothetical protein
VLQRIGTLVLGAAAALLVLAGPAGADSLVFIKDANVWLANPDGSGQHQVTLDGTAAHPYESPSQADDGTIVAVRATATTRRQLYRLRQNGALLNPPIDTPAPGTGAIDARVSPDGRLVAYWFATTVADPLCLFCVDVASRALISHADRFTPHDAIGTPNTGGWPSWIGNDTLLLTSGSATVWYYRIGMPEAAEWFADFQTGGGVPIPTLLDGEVSPDGTRLAVVRGDNQETVALYAMNGAPPALPFPFTGNCALLGATGGFSDPTWSTDGTLLAVQDGAGVSVVPVPTLTTCGPASPVIPGASEPDFGPAAIVPGARPPCANPGNPTPCGETPRSTDTTPPETKLTRRPARKTRTARVAIAFRSTERGSRFRCKLDGRPWVGCRSPFRRIVPVGRHVLRVQAIDAAGNRDRTPAVCVWRRLAATR